eukprot:TRINITY_DN723_c0_g1_i1.p1 TRINITY_DN723_c0_g1~~TRINITY_DN723_c0_g1_i1.p1  ORF type:complete len:734 (+),score=188.47 TRINITY_DN723_c0_g1_i1:206-2407(+)
MEGSSQQVSGDPSIFYTTIIITVAVSAVFFLLSIVLRKIFTRFYLRKCFANNLGRDGAIPNFEKSHTWFAWIPYVIGFKDEEILKNYGGLDQVIYLYFLKYSCILFLFLTLLNTPFLMGFYTIGSNKDLSVGSTGFVKGLDVVTMSNLEPRSAKFVAPLVCTIFSIAGVWFFMVKFAQKTSRLNVKDAKKNKINRSTVMIRELPKRLRTDDSLTAKLNKIYGSDNLVYNVRVIPEANRLRELQDECLDLNQQKKIAEDFNAENPSEPRLEMRDGLCGPKLDAVNHLETQIAEKNAKIEEKRNKIGELSSVKTPVAFVVFKSCVMANMAAQSVHRNAWNTSVHLAPDPNAIIWKNVYRGIQLRWAGTIISLTIIIALFLFWPIPIIFISGIMNLATLSQIPAFNFLVKLLERSEWLTGIIQGILPTLAIRIFMALLAFILRSLHSLEFPISETSLDRKLLNSYWAFMLFNVFFVCVISGALFKQLGPLLQKSPTEIPVLLATSFPGVTTFFINYILVNIAGHFQYLSRFIELAVCYLLKKILSKTKEEKFKREIPGPYNFVTKLSNETLVFSIALTYTTLGPLINIFAAIFFAVAYFSTKHHFMYAYTQGYEGFRFEGTTFKMLFASVLIFEILMITLFLLKSFFAGIILIPFIVLTVALYLYLERRYFEFSRFIPLDYLPIENMNEEELQRAVDSYSDPATGPSDQYGPEFELIWDSKSPKSRVDEFELKEMA